MHIVLDARTATHHFPGIGRYVFNLARALTPLLDQGEQLTLLRDPTQPSPWNLTTLVQKQVQMIDVPISPFSLSQQWRLPSLLRRLQVDLFHSSYYLMPYWPGSPTLVTIYDLIPILYSNYFSPSQRLVFRLTVHLAIHRAQNVITISEASAHDLNQLFHLPASRTTTIPLAADSIFRPVSTEVIEALRHRLGLPAQYILYLGSNKPHKNLVRLIEAFSRLTPLISRLPLLIAGVWDARFPQAQQRVEMLGLTEIVRFLGPVVEADMPALYGGATLFVFPSEYEGFGLPVLEAMACGAPVACANTSSLPEVADTAALLFDPTSVDSIVETLQHLISNDDLRAKLRQQGFSRAKQFSWEQTAQETLALYRKVT